MGAIALLMSNEALEAGSDNKRFAFILPRSKWS